MKIAKLAQRLDYHFETLNGEPVTDPEIIRSLRNREVTGITNDSRKITEGCLFFCICGARSDGHDYALQALRSGAAALVIQKHVDLSGFTPEEGREPVILRVHDSRYAMAFMSAAYYGDPASEMKIIGVTGTKGKTTTTYMVRNMLENAGFKVGIIGTIEAAYGDVHLSSPTTTPESMRLQEIFREMADAGVQIVVMEVSSQALMLHRTQGFIFDLGIFTNLSPDHIGPAEHKDFEDYLHCKSLLFRQCRVGIVNGDSPYTERVLENHTCQVETFGLKEGNDLRAVDLELVRHPGQLGVRFRTEGDPAMTAEVPMPGSFTVYNALCAIAVCRHFGVSPADIAGALQGIRVRGRIEMVDVSDAFTLMIDYAHNAMALESLLQTLREYEPGRLVCVFGCGGNRDRQRRFEMGEVSGRLADFSIITSDNPRFEEPEAIIADIVTGIAPTGGTHIEITDRKEAIAYAIHHGQPGDIIVLAGKGHEDYQEICGVKHPMDERDLIAQILEEDAAGRN